MERPALHRLLTDIDRGRIDIVVVYKVDRLTRSLMDFGRIVDRFDAKNTSFVSVTQAFNTANSMGRLTLNMLLSFAQYEREITGERIRDKIAASKARGMWMGGAPPLGYRPVGRTLEINPIEAETLRVIFKRYLGLGSIPKLRADLIARGVRGKIWINKAGVEVGGGFLARGALYHLLRNRLYLGEIVHKDKIHPGQHPAILSRELFDAVQVKLDENRVRATARPLRPGGSPLTGLVFDDAGARMSPSHARGQSGTPHRYYVSRPLLGGEPSQATITRAPAAELEALVADRIGKVIDPFDWRLAIEIIARV